MFKTLDQLQAADRLAVGGKAFNCGAMKQAGLPVPDALTVPLTATDDQVRQLPSNEWVRALPAGVTLAVRSSGLDEDSAGHSFAGMHETRLNVGIDALVDAVLRCRASSAGAAARAYREAMALGNGSASIGVLVQHMVPAAVSGVAFTVNPLTGADEFVINAAPGLGEDLVSGRVDPDEFRIDRKTSAVVSHRTGSGGAALSSKQLGELASMLARVESHFGGPQDVEWCHDGSRFWIVQSRPVTTTIAARQREKLDANSETEWTRANMAEVLPDMLAPQVLAAYDTMLNVGQRMFMGRLLAPDDELGPMFRSFGGRLYMNLSQMRRVMSIIRAPAAGLLRSLGHPEVIRPDDEVAHPAPLRESLRCLPDLLRIASYAARARHLFHKHEIATRALVARFAQIDPASLSDREIWATITGWLSSAPRALQIVFVMTGVHPLETALRKASVAAGMSYERLVYPQLAAGPRSVSSQQAYDLVALSDVARLDPGVTEYLLNDSGTFAGYRQRLAGTRFLDAFDRFLDQYGHRGRYESDWSLPRLHEQPAPALFAIRGQLQTPPGPRGTSAFQEAEAKAAWQEFENKLTVWQRLTLAPRVRRTLRRLKQQYVWREQIRSDLTRVMRYLRPLHLALADRFVERGWLASRDDYFLLTFEEIQPAIDDAHAGVALRALVRRRQTEVAAEKAIQMPFLMTTRQLAAFLANAHAVPMDPPSGAAVGDLRGLCVSPGLVEAEVVVMRDPGEFASMRRGAILVAPATDPSWTPLFTLASGVIVEIGGMLSHASTIAREYGLPALANVKHATTILKTGDRVTLDASGGRVHRS